MTLLHSLDPVIGENPKLMILGSMPGVKSLQDQQYYAHPRNAFWPIMAELFSIKLAASYAERIEQLRLCPIILWDVLYACKRQGSLDSAIRSDQLEVNGIDGLLQNYPALKLIVFNGATAERYFRQRLLSKIRHLDRYTLLRLPSTSPAHASKTLDQKLNDWSVIHQFIN